MQLRQLILLFVLLQTSCEVPGTIIVSHFSQGEVITTRHEYPLLRHYFGACSCTKLEGAAQSSLSAPGYFGGCPITTSNPPEECTVLNFFNETIVFNWREQYFEYHQQTEVTQTTYFARKDKAWSRVVGFQPEDIRKLDPFWTPGGVYLRMPVSDKSAAAESEAILINISETKKGVINFVKGPPAWTTYSFHYLENPPILEEWTDAEKRNPIERACFCNCLGLPSPGANDCPK